MAQPRMVIIAGPPGAGKSFILSLSDFAGNIFNADDRAAELNAVPIKAFP
jgi:predicted ABC-type ATPase